MAKLPSNILEFLKREQRTYQLASAKKIAGWVEEMDKRIIGGIAIGKDYRTLILDIKYQGSEIRINGDGDIEFHDNLVTNFKEFKQIWNTRFPAQEKPYFKNIENDNN